MADSIRYEENNGRLLLYFTHNSGRNFVVAEDIDGDIGKARAKLIQKMNEMNGVTDGERTSPE